MTDNGYLILENGMVFEGIGFSESIDVSGEVVFNTGMTGYPESLTDPSYCGQILALTYPLIGNYGVPGYFQAKKISRHFESERIQVRGLVISEYVESKSHWQAEVTLAQWLRKEKVPALTGIDTRSLTRIIRSKGVMKGIITFKKPRKISGLNFIDINKTNLVNEVSCKKVGIYPGGKMNILVIDCGLKNNQLRILMERNVNIIRVPWDYFPFQDNMRKFDGIFLSSGPGDPKMAEKTVSTVKEAIARKIPVFGICLGNQILALAAGFTTYKLKYGHRSENQPVINLENKSCFITTQNHSFAVDTRSVPDGWDTWFENLNDRTNEGIKHKKLPFFSVQFHPEAAPGPTDTIWLFDYFLERVSRWTGRI